MNMFKRMLLPFGVICVGLTANALTVEGLKVQQLSNPSVIDAAEPTFSWHIVSDERGVVQKSYRIIISADQEGAEIIWDSGTVESDLTQNIPATGIALSPATRYYWQVTATDNKGNEATSAEQAWFNTGLMGTGWDGAKWIKASDVEVGTVPEDRKEVTDYTVEATFEIEHTAAGICFAAADGNNFYMWQFNVEGAYPRFRPHRWQGGNPACLANVDLRGKKEITAHKEYAVRIEVTDGGKHATTYIDDVEVDSRTGEFGYGLVGIRQDKGESDGQPEIAIFDNFKVTAQSGEVLFEEDFSTDRPAMDGGDVADGRLRVVGSVQQSVYAWERTGASPLHYTVETDMTLMADNAGIVFASTGPRTYLMWQINTFDDNTYPIVRHHIYNNALYPQHSDVVVRNFRKADILGKGHHIKLDVDGKVIKTYIDDVLVDTYTDQTGVVDKMGCIGFRVDNSSSFRDNAYFDNVKVTVYGDDGTATVTLDEDFEHLPSAYFHDAIIENLNGNNKLYMPIRGIETIVLERGSKGEPMFRRDFAIDREIKSATLFTSGLGIYDLFVNDTRVGHTQPDGTTRYEELKPGRTDYNHRVPYQMHDVTGLLAAGKNAVGAIVTDGWWRGDVAHGAYGNPELAFIAKLVIDYADGTSETIVTDQNWMSSTGGAMRRGDIYEGEIYDARLETPWCSADATLTGWHGVEFSNEFKGVIQALASAPIEELTEFGMVPQSATVFKTPVHTDGDAGMIDIVSKYDNVSAITLRKGESVIYDFGQNFAGWVEFTVKGERGNRVRLRYSEMLNDTGEKSRGNDGPGGSLYLLNLRSAKAQTFYTLAGRENGETYRPTMTFFGFRYCEITATEDVEIMSVKGRPVSTRMSDTGTFECSHPDVNRLFNNVIWSQRSNFIGIPTDCPQRDERLGWAADTQIFARTALYNADAATFYHHWMETVRDGQNSEGAFPNVSPWESWDGNGAGAWADAGIVVPWMVYLMHGDTSIIEENYAAMEKYMNWLSRQTGDGYQYNGAGTTFGDWLAFVNTDSRYVSVCYYAYDVKLMEKMSRALSKEEGDTYDQKAKKYADLFEKIRAEFKRRYINGGVPSQATQTGYLLALHFGLLPDEEAIQKTVDRLESAITSNREKLNTGFVGTGVINQTLSENGLDHKAYNLLMQRECPSWLYSVDQGATTTWERWDSYRLDNGFGDYTMNSFNHYAYGAVAEWIYSFMAGIDTDESEAGFKHIILRPTPDNRTTLPAGQKIITHAGATYNSVHGLISSKWNNGDELSYEAEIPANTTATLYLPAETTKDEFFESGLPASEAEGVTFEGIADGKAVFTLGSGKYSFTRSVDTGIASAASSDAAVSVYPNPVTDTLHILTDMEIHKATLFDTTGAAVLSDTSGSVDLNLSSLNPGLYILTLETSGTPATIKVIKQ
ncbi:MAG: family 78 glycoside hydrolase catalytic domain [Bacteroidales bacterium]|nr:family 78 glycoside hydrolase catalytic domain [Bacteroidales bacterium]